MNDTLRLRMENNQLKAEILNLRAQLNHFLSAEVRAEAESLKAELAAAEAAAQTKE